MLFLVSAETSEAVGPWEEVAAGSAARGGRSRAETQGSAWRRAAGAPGSPDLQTRPRRDPQGGLRGF